MLRCDSAACRANFAKCTQTPRRNRECRWPTGSCGAPFSTLSRCWLRGRGKRSILIVGMAKMRARRPRGEQKVLSGGRKRVLVVLFVPSVERDGATPIDQPHWVDSSLEMFGRVFGGATAYPKAKGIWRDDERGGALIKDEPVVVHCYTTPADIEDDRIVAYLHPAAEVSRVLEYLLV